MAAVSFAIACGDDSSPLATGTDAGARDSPRGDAAHALDGADSTAADVGVLSDDGESAVDSSDELGGDVGAYDASGDDGTGMDSSTAIDSADPSDGADGTLSDGGNDAADSPTGDANASQAEAGDDGSSPDADAGAGCFSPDDDGGALAATPPMGWNSWNRFQGNISEILIEQVASAVATSGLRDAGYKYVNLDDVWQATSRDASGNIVPDPLRFPSGMKALADYVHCLGLKMGIYSDRGTQTCSGRPGSYGYETQDARTYAAWGIDYLKYDNCNGAPGSDMQTDYTTMGLALAATGRPIVFSLCAWWFFPWEPTVGNLWRTTTDITDTWTSLTSLLDKNGGNTSRYTDSSYGPPGLSQYAGPGHWNDPDMLEVGNGGMTDTEDRTQFSMWAMMAAPLITGNDPRFMSQATHDTLTNADVIAVDQDPLGQPGQPISASTTLEVWKKQLVGVETYAVALLNRTDAAANITVAWSELGLTSGIATVRDLWAQQDFGLMIDQYTAAVPSHGVVMLKVVGQ